ncbi:MAG: hypothetical protein EOP39_18575 [Rubrivivax sp.]|nr:MAG: hypothetical protein EOP39_18575 [Rubrivivax sp.]
MTADPFALARFEPLVGSGFTLWLDDATSLPARLVDARAGSGQVPGGRQPFSLTFEAPAEPALPQSVYRLDHPQLDDAIDLFLVPIGRVAGAVQYQAVFS